MRNSQVAASSDAPDSNISHFIPSVELKGSRIGTPTAPVFVDNKFGYFNGGDGLGRDRLGGDWVLVLTRRRLSVLDVMFVGVTVLFFVVSVGYVAVCDRLMK